MANAWFPLGLRRRWWISAVGRMAGMGGKRTNRHAISAPRNPLNPLDRVAVGRGAKVLLEMDKNEFRCDTMLDHALSLKSGHARVE